MQKCSRGEGLRHAGGNDDQCIELDLDGLTVGFQILNCSVYIKVCSGQSHSVTEVTPPRAFPRWPLMNIIFMLQVSQI